MNYYAILGVDPSAPIHTIRRRFEELRAKHQLSDEIKLAYWVVGEDGQRRKTYDSKGPAALQDPRVHTVTYFEAQLRSGLGYVDPEDPVKFFEVDRPRYEVPPTHPQIMLDRDRQFTAMVNILSQSGNKVFTPNLDIEEALNVIFGPAFNKRIASTEDFRLIKLLLPLVTKEESYYALVRGILGNIIPHHAVSGTVTGAEALAKTIELLSEAQERVPSLRGLTTPEVLSRYVSFQASRSRKSAIAWRQRAAKAGGRASGYEPFSAEVARVRMIVHYFEDTHTAPPTEMLRVMAAEPSLDEGWPNPREWAQTQLSNLPQRSGILQSLLRICTALRRSQPHE
jgi:hypothetical protein